MLKVNGVTKGFFILLRIYNNIQFIFLVNYSNLHMVWIWHEAGGYTSAIPISNYKQICECMHTPTYAYIWLDLWVYYRRSLGYFDFSLNGVFCELCEKDNNFITEQGWPWRFEWILQLRDVARSKIKDTLCHYGEINWINKRENHYFFVGTMHGLDFVGLGLLLDLQTWIL